MIFEIINWILAFIWTIIVPITWVVVVVYVWNDSKYIDENGKSTMPIKYRQYFYISLFFVLTSFFVLPIILSSLPYEYTPLLPFFEYIFKVIICIGLATMGMGIFSYTIGLFMENDQYLSSEPMRIGGNMFIAGIPFIMLGITTISILNYLFTPFFR